MSAILLAPGFDAGALDQKDAHELTHDPRLTAAVRTARAICDAVEDQESRSDAVVFESPAEREAREDVERAARRLAELGEQSGRERKAG